MKTIDMHMHTTNSDGNCSTKQVLEQAQKLGLSLISITDHNSVNAYFDLENDEVRNSFSGEIVAGTEITTLFNNVVIEVLTYGFEVRKMKAFLDNYFSEEKLIETRKNEVLFMKKVAKEEGLIFDENFDPSAQSIATFTNFYRHLITFPENESYMLKNKIDSGKTFFRDMVCNDNTKFFFDYTKCYPSIKEISDFAKKNGCKTFLAHPYIYRFENKVDSAFQIVKEGNLSGVEAYHSSASEEMSEVLTEKCKENKLLYSGGSDYHGFYYRKERIGKVVGGEKPLDYGVFEKMNLKPWKNEKVQSIKVN